MGEQYRYSRKLASRVVKFVEALPHVKGEWARAVKVESTGERRSRLLRLEPFQRKFISKLFGTLKTDGTRRYRTAYMEIPRKNAKTTIAAALGLYLLTCDDEPGAEIYSAGKDQDQAAISYNIAKLMIQRTPALRKRLVVYDGPMRIVHEESGSFWQALPGKIEGNWGLNAHAVIFDELHAQPNSDLWDVLTTSIGARRQPLVFTITTAGYDRHSICYRLHQRARRAERNPDADPSFLGLIYAADPKDDWTSERTWKKANPLYPISPKPDYMRGECLRAKNDPSYENTFKRLHLNIWTQQATRFIPMDKWYACPARPPLPELALRPCYGGLDLAAYQDLVALALLFPPTADVPFYDLYVRLWCPEERVAERSRKDKVPYDEWVKQGHIIATPGSASDYDFIEDDVKGLKADFRILEIGYDRWQAIQMVQHLTAFGYTMTAVGMGTGSMSDPLKNLLRLILELKIRHGNNPVLDWMADNLSVKQNAAGDIKPAKDTSGDKIDGIVATCIALYCALSERKPEESVYKARGLRILRPPERGDVGAFTSERQSESRPRISGFQD